MGPVTLVGEAFHSLGKNKVRSFLSILGIVIGVAAVIAMVAIGEGARKRVEQEIATLGDDWLMIGFWGIQRGGARGAAGTTPTQAEEDAKAIANGCTTIRATSPSNRLNVQVVSSYSNYQSNIQGVEASYFDIRRWSPSRGAAFGQEDSDFRRRVCCLGQTVVKELFGTVDPIGEDIRINQLQFRVIGVMAAKGTSSDGRDNDDVILVPWGTFKAQLAGNEVAQTLFAAARPGVPLAVAKAQVRSLLRQRHRLAEEEDDDFRIIDRALTMQVDAAATQTFNTLLAAIASISLLVGGIGIMNIMLVSVTERTREIGLRMAIGANGFHVLGQFLVEAVTLCALGGALGFLAGYGVAQFVGQYGLPVQISYWMAGVAIAFASGVGLFFGFYPAWRASRLDPIEALRYE